MGDPPADVRPTHKDWAPLLFIDQERRFLDKLW
jgi:hypothetical protein